MLEWDFFCDCQTPWHRTIGFLLHHCDAGWLGVRNWAKYGPEVMGDARSLCHLSVANFDNAQMWSMMLASSSPEGKYYSCTLMPNLNFCPKIQFWWNLLKLWIWIFPPKMGLLITFFEQKLGFCNSVLQDYYRMLRRRIRCEKKFEGVGRWDVT